MKQAFHAFPWRDASWVLADGLWTGITWGLWIGMMIILVCAVAVFTLLVVIFTGRLPWFVRKWL